MTELGVECQLCGSVDLYGNSAGYQCADCKAFGALQCMKCGETDGFPHTQTWCTFEDAKRTKVALKSSDLIKTAAEIRSKSMLYCPQCYHNHYFTETEGKTMSCTLCHTSWPKTQSCVHDPAALVARS